MEITIYKLKVQVNQSNFKLNMGARDKSFMNKVSSLAKWLFQSMMAFIISKIMHSFSIQRFMQKLVPNASRSLTVKDHTFIGQWLVITFTIYLSNQLTFSIMSLIHVLSLLITAYSFKAHDLIIAIHSIHAIDQSNFIHKHKIFKQSTHCIINQNCKLFNKL